MQYRATLSLLGFAALVYAAPSRALSCETRDNSNSKSSSSISSSTKARSSTKTSTSVSTKTSSIASASSTASTSSSSCTFTSTDSLAAGKDSCTDIVLDGITVPAGETLDLTDLADGTSVTFQGTTSFEYEEWDGPLISVSGVSITVTGASGHVIDGNGAAWWDGKGSNGGVTKPKFFAAHKLNSSTITGLNVKNTPVQAFSINDAYDLTLQDITIDDSDGDSAGGHNTDAFDVGSSDGVRILGAVVKNQDDCLAVNSGSNIEFSGGSCSGGHGLSIGSVGGRTDNDVSNVYISSSSVSNSENGVRIKTVYDATGSVNNVTYTDITLSNITDYGIVIEQDYENGSPTGTPTTGVPITDLTLDGVTGTVADDATEIYILCGSGSCSDWTWSDVSITGGEASSECSNVPSGASC
ncbi:glycoside hydrolase family 28 protein [Hypoxylon sp. FL1150]|nr:glycoside hydrolase family 28 protein [Hypoxylon sp. FL1150]